VDSSIALWLGVDLPTGQMAMWVTEILGHRWDRFELHRVHILVAIDSCSQTVLFAYSHFVRDFEDVVLPVSILDCEFILVILIKNDCWVELTLNSDWFDSVPFIGIRFENDLINVSPNIVDCRRFGYIRKDWL
jgi:hypothetical protein